MKLLKRILILLLVAALAFSMASCSALESLKGDKGDKGDAGAKGEKGDKGDKGDAGEASMLTSIRKTSTVGNVDTYTMTFSNGFAYSFSVKNGEKGDTGDTVTVSEIKIIGTEGLVDTYTMLLSDGSNFNFQVTNGKEGEGVSVTSVEKTSTVGLVDVYTIYYSNGQQFDFTVTNGEDGDVPKKVTISNVSFSEEKDTERIYKISYSDETESFFSVITAGENISGAVTEYAELSTLGYEGTLDEFIIGLTNQTAKALVTSGSVLGAKTLGAAMSKLLKDYDTYYISNVQEILLREVVLDYTTQVAWEYMLNNKNVASANANYAYNTVSFKVNPGEIFTMSRTQNPYPLNFRYWTYYLDGTHVESLSGEDGKVGTGKLIIPEGVNELKVTWKTSTDKNQDGVAKIYKNSISLSLGNNLDTYTVNVLVNGTTGGSGAPVNDPKVDMLTSTVLGNGSILVTKDTLPVSEFLYVGNSINTVMNNKTLTLSCNIDGTLGEDEAILVGHGLLGEDGDYGAAWLELTGTHIKIHQNANKHETQEFAHGLTIKDFVNITIDANLGTAKVTLGSPDGMYQISSCGWTGRNGRIFAMSETTELKNVNLRWHCEAYSAKIWMYGDSYFSLTDNQRWPSYLNNDGYTDNVMLSGYPGMKTEVALEQFKVDLTYGTPKYAVWCMGMNDYDNDKTTVNTKWQLLTEEFLTLCEEKGITPILATIPTTPTRFNYAKSEWVKASGYRYIDFARAVGGYSYDETIIGTTYANGDQTLTNITGNEWYSNMLFRDLVHPTQLGARALYTQVLVDFPEITEQK